MKKKTAKKINKRINEREEIIKVDNTTETTIYKLRLRHRILVDKEQRIKKEKESIEEIFKKNRMEL